MSKIKVLTVLLALSALFTFVSCDFGPEFYVKKGDKAAFALAGYHIPGASSGLNVKVELVEEDSHGRKLYRFSCLSTTGNLYADGYDEEASENLRAYLISQKETKEGVYYMDSVCYMVRLSWDEFTDELLDDLKALNQWGGEMDDADLCFCPLTNADKPLYAEVKAAYTAYTGKEIDESRMYISYVCNDANGKCLAFVREYDKMAREPIGKAYAFIATPSKVGEEFYVVELNDFYQHNDEIKKMKADAGWVSS